MEFSIQEEPATGETGGGCKERKRIFAEGKIESSHLPVMVQLKIEGKVMLKRGCRPPGNGERGALKENCSEENISIGEGKNINRTQLTREF